MPTTVSDTLIVKAERCVREHTIYVNEFRINLMVKI